jgi:TPR repeat protein
MFLVCCCRKVCRSCDKKIGTDACPLCRIPCAEDDADQLARLRRHVENDVPEAISHLGNVYRGGRLGLVKSDKKAAKIYRRAVELGDMDAMVFLGEMYKYGEGVKLDKKKADRLFRMAADRGHSAAQTSLACLLHSQGKFEEAFRYFALAANQGETFAETSLGCCYRDGEGTEVDLGKARYWFERAAAKGDEDAIKALADLDARV